MNNRDVLAAAEENKYPNLDKAGFVPRLVRFSPSDYNLVKDCAMAEGLSRVEFYEVAMRHLLKIYQKPNARLLLVPTPKANFKIHAVRLRLEVFMAVEEVAKQFEVQASRFMATACVIHADKIRAAKI